MRRNPASSAGAASPGARTSVNSALQSAGQVVSRSTPTVVAASAATTAATANGPEWDTEQCHGRPGVVTGPCWAAQRGQVRSSATSRGSVCSSLGDEAAQHGGSQHEAVPVALLPQPRQAVLLVVVEELDVAARQVVGAGPPHVHHDGGRHDVTLEALPGTPRTWSSSPTSSAPTR